MTSIRPFRFLPFVLLASVILLGGAPQVVHGEPGDELVAARSGFVPPLQLPLRLNARFDPPAEKWLAGHRGVDLGAVPGSPVKSAGAGVVHYVGTVVDRPVISIDHGVLRTTYEPVKSDLASGQAVVAGQVIGTIAEGGHCSESCLHWGLKRGEEYLDPLALLKTDPPVLKPPI